MSTLPGVENNVGDVESMSSDFAPVPDACTERGCRLTAAQHVGWKDGGPWHSFTPAKPQPKPERIADSFILTTWTCTHCGAQCDVWGVADREWMQCLECGKDSYVVYM